MRGGFRAARQKPPTGLLPNFSQRVKKSFGRAPREQRNYERKTNPAPKPATHNRAARPIVNVV
jgi:hypothetical protein